MVGRMIRARRCNTLSSAYVLGHPSRKFESGAILNFFSTREHPWSQREKPSRPTIAVETHVMTTGGEFNVTATSTQASRIFMRVPNVTRAEFSRPVPPCDRVGDHHKVPVLEIRPGRGL